MYELAWTALEKRLTTLDSTIPRTNGRSAAVMDATAMTKLIAKKVKEAVSAMTGKTTPFKKGYSEGFTKNAEKSKVPFSKEDMQQLYTPA